VVTAVLSVMAVIDYSTLVGRNYQPEIVDIESVLFYAPGFLFALCLSIYISIKSKNTLSTRPFIIKNIFWIIVSTVGYYLAVWTAFFSADIEAFIGFTAGLVGSIIVFVGYKLTIANNRKNFNFGNFIKMTLTGAILGLIWSVGFFDALKGETIFPLFFIWQPIMLAIIGAIDKDTIIQNN